MRCCRPARPRLACSPRPHFPCRPGLRAGRSWGSEGRLLPWAGRRVSSPPCVPSSEFPCVETRVRTRASVRRGSGRLELSAHVRVQICDSGNQMVFGAATDGFAAPPTTHSPSLPTKGARDPAGSAFQQAGAASAAQSPSGLPFSSVSFHVVDFSWLQLNFVTG